MVKVHSYIARYPVLGTVQSVLHFTPGRPVHSNAISTSLGSREYVYMYIIYVIYNLCNIQYIHNIRHLVIYILFKSFYEARVLNKPSPGPKQDERQH